MALYLSFSEAPLNAAYPEPMKLGIVSDTHGLLRPEVIPALKGVDQILHLGDVGKTPFSTSSRRSRRSLRSAAT